MSDDLAPEVTDLVAIGKFGRTHGVAGDVRVRFYKGDASRLAGLTRLYLIKNVPANGTTGAAMKTLEIERAIGGIDPKVKIVGYDTPEQTRGLVNQEIFVPRGALPPAPAGEEYVFNLIGMQVEDETGANLGALESVESYPANDVYVIRDQSGQERLFPAVPEFMVRIDKPRNTIVIRPPKGIFDE